MFDQLCACLQAPDLHAHDEDGDVLPVGWQVVDPDGRVVQAGGISIARADGRLQELIDQARTNGDE